MERLLRVEFGPSRSKRFGRALAEAKSGAGECSELEPGRYRVGFLLGSDPSVYRGLARLLGRARHWRATEVYEQEGLVSAYHAKEMAWCASCQLTSFGDCRVRFFFGVWPRCSLCPLFNAQRALQDALGENTPPAMRVEINLRPDLRALLQGELPTTSAGELDPDWELPDYPPAGWGEPHR